MIVVYAFSFRYPVDSPQLVPFLPELSIQKSNRACITPTVSHEAHLRSILASEKSNPVLSDAYLAAAALPHSIAHQYTIDWVTKDFIDALASCPEDKWQALLEPVEYMSMTGMTHAPKILVDLGGTKSTAKLMLANKSVIDWMAVIRKKPAKGQKCPWYQPSTQNQRLRVFFGSVQKCFNWTYELKDFNFKGGIKAFLDTLYAKRLAEFGEVSDIYS